LHSVSEGSPRLLWEGPALPLTDVPAAAYSHRNDSTVASPQDSVSAGHPKR